MDYIWQIAPLIPGGLKNDFPEIHPLVLQLLWNRQLKTQEKIDEFLLPDYSQDLHDPFLFNEMDRVVGKILSVINNHELITVYGDYDADGVCGTAILYSTLKKLGAEVNYYLPDREKEGYGLNKEAIKKIINDGTKLIITVDCGITNFEEVDLANELGMQTIITDHHIPLDKLPKALFILNPYLKEEKYPFKDLSGAGVAFKLVQALLKKQSVITNSEAFEKWLLDLVAVGTTADLVNLKGENRTLVKYGLVVLNKTSRAGLRMLIKRAGLNLGKLDANSIAFQIATRLNAAGRVDHANVALEMLLSQDKKEAGGLAEKLNQLNQNRQKIAEKIFEETKTEIGENPSDKIIIHYHEKWPVGILGLISHKITEFYNRPSILITIREKDIKGCGRSIEHFNLIESLKELENFFSHYGGHSGAAGFTLKEKDMKLLDKFCEELKKKANEKLQNLDLRPKIFIESEINLSEVNWPLYEEIKKFEPFGKENPSPNFLTKNLTAEEIKSVGKNNQHKKIIVTGGKKMIYFAAGNKLDHLKKGDEIDVVFELSENIWDGMKELEFKIIDLKPSHGQES